MTPLAAAEAFFAASFAAGLILAREGRTQAYAEAVALARDLRAQCPGVTKAMALAEVSRRAAIHVIDEVPS